HLHSLRHNAVLLHRPCRSLIRGLDTPPNARLMASIVVTSWLSLSGRDSLFLAIRAELLEIVPECVDLFLLLDPYEHHGCAGDLRSRILYVLLESVFIPGNAGV